MKHYFGLEKKYEFDWNDLSAFFTVLNVILVMTYGLSIAWFGLALAVVGLVKVLLVDHKINLLIMKIALIIMNAYFIGLSFIQ